jgi:hypothetical protein
MSPTATLLSNGNGWRDRAIAIQKVNTNIDLGEVVVVQGQVIRQVPFLESGAYLVQGKTGQIWITTSSSLPSKGTQVVVQGTLKYRHIEIEGQDLGKRYLQQEQRAEKQQKTHEPRSPSSRDRYSPTGRLFFAATAR